MTTPFTHICPAVQKGTLPPHVRKSAESGDIEEVTKFLMNGGNINSGDVHGQNLIMTACAAGQSNLLRELLKYPGIHLNNRSQGITAIFHAVHQRHNECIKILLAVRGVCRVNLRMKCATKAISMRMTPLQLSAFKRHWNSFSILLKETDIIDHEEAYTIFESAFHDDQWEIMRELLQHDISYESDFFHRVMREAYVLDLSDIFHTLFQKCVDDNGIQNNLEFLLTVFKGKDWVNLESLLKIILPRAKFDASVAELLSERKYEEVAKMLSGPDLDYDVTNGNLILACLAGCNEEIAELSLADVTECEEITLNYALLLASTNNRMEMVPVLLEKADFSYCILVKALEMTEEGRRKPNLLQIMAIAEKINELFPEAAKTGRFIMDYVSP